jgi:hypothetical protein
VSLPLLERCEDAGAGRVHDAKYLQSKFPLIAYSLANAANCVNYSEHAKSPVVDKRPMMEVMENARGRMNIGKSPGTVIITSRAYGSPADMQTEFITITITSSISNMSCTGSKKKICHLQTWRSNTKVM